MAGSEGSWVELLAILLVIILFLAFLEVRLRRGEEDDG